MGPPFEGEAWSAGALSTLKTPEIIHLFTISENFVGHTEIHMEDIHRVMSQTALFYPNTNFIDF
jgi:hypothetical protein